MLKFSELGNLEKIKLWASSGVYKGFVKQSAIGNEMFLYGAG